MSSPGPLSCLVVGAELSPHGVWDVAFRCSYGFFRAVGFEAFGVEVDPARSALLVLVEAWDVQDVVDAPVVSGVDPDLGLGC